MICENCGNKIKKEYEVWVCRAAKKITVCNLCYQKQIGCHKRNKTDCQNCQYSKVKLPEEI